MALRGGARFTVPFEAVFPHGCVFVPDSIAEAQDFNEATRQRTPSKDKVTGQRVWQCRVMDMDPELGSRSREVSIKILADHQPVPPVGPFQPVEFENLTVTPYVGNNNRLAYSFRATALVAPKTLAETRKAAA
ncbi:transcriptional regulator [Micromonospora sp. SCSIO 07396]